MSVDSQQTNRCSKSTTESLEKGLNMFTVNHKDIEFVLVSLRLTLNIFHTFLSFSVVVLKNIYKETTTGIGGKKTKRFL